MLKSIAPICLLLLLVASCSTPTRQSNLASPVETVSIGGDDSQLSIDKKHNIAYGPSLGFENDIRQKVTADKKALISLVLLPSLYDSLSYLELFNQLDRKEIKPSIIVSSGFTALVAALYAKKQSTNYLEWKVFDLLKNIKNERMYSEGWNRKISSFIDKEFKNVDINALKILMLIPEVENGKLKFVKSGKISKILKRTVFLNKPSNYVINPIPFWENKSLKKVGSDLEFIYLSAPKIGQFSALPGFLWGVYTSYLGKMHQNTQDLMLIAPEKTYIADQLIPLSDYKSYYRVAIKFSVEQMALAIDEWQQENSASSN